MGNASGLQGPEGRPARQFGEEIIEPGEPFSGETISTIRSLVTGRESDNGSDTQEASTFEEPPVRDPMCDPVSDEMVDTSQPPVEPTPVPVVAEVVTEPEPVAMASYPVPRVSNTVQSNDVADDDFANFAQLAASYAAAMRMGGEPQSAPETILEHAPQPEVAQVEDDVQVAQAVAEIVQAEPVLTPMPDPEVSTKDKAGQADQPKDLEQVNGDLVGSIAQVMSDMDSFAGSRLAEIEAVGTEDETLPEPAGWKPVAVEPVPPLKVKRKWLERPPKRSKPEWRRLNVVEGAPGRAVRQFLSQPRNIAFMMLVYISLWRPWFIPTLTFVIFLTILLVVIAMGPDRVASFAGWWFARLNRRNPKRAERLIRKGNKLLRRVEVLADRLPPAWVDSFYLPELDGEDRSEVNDAQLKERLERIAAQEQVGAT